MEYLHQVQLSSGDLIWFDLPGVADYEDGWVVGPQGVESYQDCVCYGHEGSRGGVLLRFRNRSWNIELINYDSWIYIVIMISHEDLLNWGILDIDQWFVEWFPSHKCQKPFLFINWFCMISLLAIFLSLLLVFPTVLSTCKSRKSLGLSFSRSTFARIQRAKWWTVQWEL